MIEEGGPVVDSEPDEDEDIDDVEAEAEAEAEVIEMIDEGARLPPSRPMMTTPRIRTPRSPMSSPQKPTNPKRPRMMNRQGPTTNALSRKAVIWSPMKQRSR
ncbi:MAG: hypothetical protein R2843_05675 [Thermomicrobiales bacterium]